MFDSIIASCKAWCRTYLDFRGGLGTALIGTIVGLILCMLDFGGSRGLFIGSVTTCAAAQAALMIQLLLNGVAKTTFAPFHKVWTIVSGGLIAIHMALCTLLAAIAIQMMVAPGLLYFALCVGTYVLMPLLFVPFFLAHQHFIVNTVAGNISE